MFTPEGRSRRCSESTVRGVGCWMSMRRLCVCSWKCSRESLSLKGPRITVYRLLFVGRGTGPKTKAPVRSAVSTMDLAVLSMTSWSYAFSFILIFDTATDLLHYLGNDTSTNCPAALAYGKVQPLVHRDRAYQLHVHYRV